MEIRCADCEIERIGLASKECDMKNSILCAVMISEFFSDIT